MENSDKSQETSAENLTENNDKTSTESSENSGSETQENSSQEDSNEQSIDIEKEKTEKDKAENKEETNESKLKTDFNNPDYYFNKELSWLDFNARVLEQAFDKNIPLLERLNFLCIFSSNLDEFFMIRVAGLKEQVIFGSSEVGPDKMMPRAQLIEISKKVNKSLQMQYECFSNEIVPALSKEGIHILDINNMSEEQEELVQKTWRNMIFPVLTPLAVDPSHPFPKLANTGLNLLVELNTPDTEEKNRIYFAFVPIPRVIDRLISISPAKEGHTCFVLLEDIIKKYSNELFPGLEIKKTSVVKVSRNSDLTIVEEEASDLLKAIEQQVRRRKQGEVVRLEVQQNLPSRSVMEILMENLNIELEKDVYVLNGPLNLQDFFDVCRLEDYPHLKYEPFMPYAPKFNDEDKQFYDTLKEKDILLYHPYESFQSVIDFISTAAEDPNVLAIKQTLYRTAKDSPFVDALISAAENGKQVTALVEIKARFDEELNINWAKKLEKAGVNVVYGLVGLKTHAKMALVVRREGKKIKRYVHLSTGNYNQKTARLYSDIGFFTSRKSFSEDVLLLFNVITGYANLPPMKKMYAAPLNLKERILEAIKQEKENKLKGKPARIVAKMNSISKVEIVQALYEASQAGVEIILIVRGMCCLRPGVKGLSENIKIYSIIDRFLEHTRIFYFYNDGLEDVYLSSADWRTRNLDRRIETMFPIDDAFLKHRLINEILLSQLDCNSHKYELQSDGTYIRHKPTKEHPLSYQQEMVNLANRRKTEAKTILQGITTEFIKKKKKKNKDKK